MGIRIKPKSYGPVAVGPDIGKGLVYTTESGRRGSVGTQSDASAENPSDLILASLGSCICISLQMAADSLRYAVSDIKATVTASKATSLPHRIETFDVSVGFESELDDAAIRKLLSDTKKLCTISNTIAAEIRLHYDDGRV